MPEKTNTLIPYASRTGTKRNLAALRGAGWRLLVSATGVRRTEGFRYALDNGAWTAHQQQRPFDGAAFRKVVSLLGEDADWVVAPDVVAGGLDSLALTRCWLPWCLERCQRVLIAVQDGMTPPDVADLVSARVGIAIGGRPLTDEERAAGVTEWKEIQLARNVWGPLCRSRGAWLHALRVNSARRIALCANAGCHSFDGTSATQFAVTLPRLDAARRQQSLIPLMGES